MYLSDRREQSRLLAEQLGVPLPPVLKPEESKAEGDNVAESTENIGSAENTCSKRRCVEVRGEELESPAGTMGSQSSAETVTGEVRERVRVLKEYYPHCSNCLAKSILFL